VLFESVFIVTVVAMTPVELEEVLGTLTPINVPPPRKDRPKGLPVFGKHEVTGALRESYEKCTFELTGRPFVNKATMKLRLDKGLAYKGYLLQSKPFNGGTLTYYVVAHTWCANTCLHWLRSHVR